MLKRISLFLLIPLLLNAATLSHADDTEIYLNTNALSAGKPLVMLALDYRSNLASRVCNGYSDTLIPGSDKPECWDFFNICTATDAGTGECTAGQRRHPQVPLNASSVSFYELLVAALNLVFLEILDDVGENQFRLGLMLNHQDTTVGQCGAGPTTSDLDRNMCSNGGYIYLGFKDFNEAYRLEFISKMLELNTSEFIDANAPNHPYQGAELYFEFFRYLTGQQVYNGHKGFDDFTNPNNTQNLGYTLGFYPPSTTTFNLPTVIVPDSGFDHPQLGWDGTIETEFNPAAASDEGMYTYRDVDADNPYQYISPLTEECSKIFVINFMFQVSQQENNSDDAIEASKDDQGLGIRVSSNNAFVDVLRAMNTNYFDDGTWGNAPELGGTANVTSYFFVDDTKINNTTNGYAAAGGTVSAKPLSSDNPEKLIDDLLDTLSSILSISTTFVSATVPVNVFNRSESLENVYFGVFEAEETPQWPGNVKRLRLRQNAGVLEVVDALCPATTDPDNPPPCDDAIGADGRIRNEVLSLWTDSGGADVVAFDPDKDEVSGRDGRSVNRGGAGQQIPGFLGDAPSESNGSGRTIYMSPDSYTNGSLNSLDNLNADAETAEDVWEDLCETIQANYCPAAVAPDPTCGTSPVCTTWEQAATVDSNSDAISANDQEAAINLLKFARGIDVFDRDGDTETDDARPWLFGDILHSQPTPVNYGATGGGYDSDNPELYVIVASNDGSVRMVRNNTAAGAPDGEEVWAFMPREVMPILGELAGDSAATPHPYGVDGTISILTAGNEIDGTISGDDIVWAYYGLRRGGKAYYAMDISDPDDPKLLWKVVRSDDENDEPDDPFYELGQTWSKPVIEFLRWDDTNGDSQVDGADDVLPVIIVGGGYDTRKDDDQVLGSGDPDDTEGNALFVIDAITGNLIWKAVKGDSIGNVSESKYTHTGLRDSIPSDIRPADVDGDGIVDRAYVADTGGVVWRADFAGTSGDWTITPILSAGRHAGAACNNDGDSTPDQCPDRRFFHAPGLVRVNDNESSLDSYIGVNIGSGTRPDPRQIHFDESTDPATQLYDQFYHYKDYKETGYYASSITAAPVTPDMLADLTNSDKTTVNAAACTSDPSGEPCSDYEKLRDNGWLISFITGDGEKLLASSTTFGGVVYFSTYVPAGSGLDLGQSGQCGPPEGLANSYAILLEDASPVAPVQGGTPAEGRSVFTGSGIPSDPIVIVLDGNIYITPGNIPTTGPGGGARLVKGQISFTKTYWYENLQ